MELSAPPVKICLISPWCYQLLRNRGEGKFPFGGSEVQQVELGKALLKKTNYTVSFMVGGFYRGQPDRECITLEGREVWIYKTIACFNRIWGVDSVLDIWRLYRAMKAINANVYLLRGGGSLAGTVAFLARKVFGKKFIYSSAHDRDSNGEFFKNHSFLINYAFKYGLKNANALICQHRDQQKAFQRNLGLKAHVMNTMYAMGSNPPTPKLRDYVLWVSRLNSWKRPEVFVALAKHFPTRKFLMITNSEAQTFSKKIGTHPTLKILEKVPLEKMDAYFEKAKLFVNTSRTEGFPNTFVQAAKNGTPILSLTVNPEGMLEKNAMGRCAYDDFDRLVEDLAETLKDKNLWRKMSENAYNYARKHHDRDRIVADYVKIFES